MQKTSGLGMHLGKVMGLASHPRSWRLGLEKAIVPAGDYATRHLPAHMS